VPFDQVEHVVDAVMPTAEQAALLEMPATEPCLLLTRRTWSRGVPITVVRCLHPASRYRLGSRFRASMGTRQRVDSRHQNPSGLTPFSNLIFSLILTCIYRMRLMTTSTSFASPCQPPSPWCRARHAWRAAPHPRRWRDLHARQQALAGMQAAQATVQRIVDEDQVVYGINTGFGKLASTKIAHDRLAELQRNLVLSHSVGTGDALPDGVVRLMLATKAVSLARGHSGIRPAIVDALLALANANVLPVIPAKGSVGASGDLAPLAHLACVLIGEGQAKVDGKVVSGAEAMRAVGLQPFVLGPKEGLALLNGTQVSTALALAGLFGAETCSGRRLVAGCAVARSHQGLGQAVRCAHPRGARPAGQIAVAAAVRGLLDGSEIDPSHPTAAACKTRTPSAACRR
jgi:hypothetical protein